MEWSSQISAYLSDIREMNGSDWFCFPKIGELQSRETAYEMRHVEVEEEDLSFAHSLIFFNLRLMPRVLPSFIFNFFILKYITIFVL